MKDRHKTSTVRAVRLPLDFKAEVEAYCARRGIAFNRMVIELLKKEIGQQVCPMCRQRIRAKKGGK
ncbi:MAG: hypothetical protein HYT87_13240 [Nitrospirae bacterium]|nr:hypothetical protein [Nitrospirota bacterium]